MPPGPKAAEIRWVAGRMHCEPGPVNKADGLRYMLFLLCVLSGAQPGTREQSSALAVPLTSVGFSTLYARSCVPV